VLCCISFLHVCVLIVILENRPPLSPLLCSPFQQLFEKFQRPFLCIGGAPPSPNLQFTSTYVNPPLMSFLAPTLACLNENRVLWKKEIEPVREKVRETHVDRNQGNKEIERDCYGKVRTRLPSCFRNTKSFFNYLPCDPIHRDLSKDITSFNLFHQCICKWQRVRWYRGGDSNLS
jgi:hypothetical protein